MATVKNIPAYSVRRGEIAARVVLAVLSIAIVGVMWLIGAYFTSVAVTAIALWGGVAIPTDQGRWLIVPIIFSIVEVVAWAYRHRLPGAILVTAAGVAALDFATTAYGVPVTVAGRTLPLLIGYKIPDLMNAAGTPNTAPVVIGLISALVFTFVPEKVMMSAVRDIVKAVKILSAQG